MINRNPTALVYYRTLFANSLFFTFETWIHYFQVNFVKRISSRILQKPSPTLCVFINCPRCHHLSNCFFFFPADSDSRVHSVPALAPTEFGSRSRGPCAVNAMKYICGSQSHHWALGFFKPYIWQLCICFWGVSGMWVTNAVLHVGYVHQGIWRMWVWLSETCRKSCLWLI